MALLHTPNFKRMRYGNGLMGAELIVFLLPALNKNALGIIYYRHCELQKRFFAIDLRLMNDRYEAISQGACLIIISIIMLYISVISTVFYR